MKKIIINGQMRNKPFLIVIYYSSLVKAAMNPACCTAHAFVKCAMVLAKRPQCRLFSTVKGGMNILRSNTLKGSQRMGGGQIFLKTFRASLFNEDLSNEPNFGRIHLAGQYL
jgi:hypothetical protein